MNYVKDYLTLVIITNVWKKKFEEIPRIISTDLSIFEHAKKQNKIR